ncbi:MAG: hypothetical protein Q8P46_07045 [Hyphomicrobiales bacterium]|nr:hypothetical protein [Hyphomicrobiales bacterium]
MSINKISGAGLTVIGAVTDAGAQDITVRTVLASADASATPADISAAPASGEKIVLDDLFLSVDTDLLVTVKEETSGTVMLALYMAAGTAQQFTPRGKMKLPVAGKKLQVQTSATGNIKVTALTHGEA